MKRISLVFALCLLAAACSNGGGGGSSDSDGDTGFKLDSPTSLIETPPTGGKLPADLLPPQS